MSLEIISDGGRPGKARGGEEFECQSQDSDEAFCSICFGEFTEEDPQAAKADAKGHGIIFECGHAAALHLSCLTLEAQQNRPFQCPLCRTKFGFSKTCICGCDLQERLSSKPIPEYDGAGVQCDHCSRSVTSRESIYHCPRGKIEAHPAGYDICGRCAIQSAHAARVQAAAMLLTCNCGHQLVYNPMTTNTCDINGPGCKKQGTTFRCGSGCDFDACIVCYSTKTRVRRVRRRTHSLRARRNASATRAGIDRSSAPQAEGSRPRSQSVTGRRPAAQSGQPASRLLSLVRNTSMWGP